MRPPFLNCIGLRHSGPIYLALRRGKHDGRVDFMPMRVPLGVGNWRWSYASHCDGFQCRFVCRKGASRAIMNSMKAVLSDELRQAVRESGGDPVKIEDRQTNQIYYLVPGQQYEQFQELLGMQQLDREAAAGRREEFDKYLAAVPDVPAPELDRLE